LSEWAAADLGTDRVVGQSAVAITDQGSFALRLTIFFQNLAEKIAFL
jgi:hypothetical protein